MDTEQQLMPERVKVRRIGNSAGVVLTKEMLATLRVEVGDDLNVVVTQHGLELTAYEGSFDDALKWIEEGAKRYRNTLRALSK